MRSRRFDAALLARPLATVVDAPEDVPPGGLLSLWNQVTVGDLPASVVRTALAATSPEPILKAMTSPKVVASACDELIARIKAEAIARAGQRTAHISLARSGLTTEFVPTLEDLGIEYGLSRERIRQLELPLPSLVGDAVSGRTAPALCLLAWFDLHGGPFTTSDVAALAKTASQARCLRFVLQHVGFPCVDWYGPLWMANRSRRESLSLVVNRGLFRVGLAEVGWSAVAAAIERHLPELTGALDVEETLRRIGQARNFGPGIDGRLQRDLSGHRQRVARKIETYLFNRVHPISLRELADVIAHGWPPFEVFERPAVDPNWLRECIRRESRLLVLGRRDVSLRAGAQAPPLGIVKTLRDALVDHRRPMKMQDLCDLAARDGISRNQVGTLIHSRRAACLFMLERGVVGLVGRDEGADPAISAAAAGGARTRVRPGQGIAVNETGELVADMTVRRSVREQGLGLPWPFSIVLLDDHARLVVDEEPVPMAVRPNGDLLANFLEPGSSLRLRLSPRPRAAGAELELTTRPTSSLAGTGDSPGVGAWYAPGLAPEENRPGWVAEYMRRYADRALPGIDAITDALPSLLSPRRRLHAAYGLVALGFVQKRAAGWKPVAAKPLPPLLEAVFSMMRSRPGAYHTIGRREQAAVRWLVEAGWLVAAASWSIVQPNDLAGPPTVRNGQEPAARPSVGEVALLKIVEAAQQAQDHLAHPVGDPLVTSRATARRVLNALGFTNLGAVRDVDGAASDGAAIEYGHLGNRAVGVWKLRPLGQPVRANDIDEAQAIARRAHARAWGATNGLRLVLGAGTRKAAIRLADVASGTRAFTDLVELSGSSLANGS